MLDTLPRHGGKEKHLKKINALGIRKPKKHKMKMK